MKINLTERQIEKLLLAVNARINFTDEIDAVEASREYREIRAVLMGKT